MSASPKSITASLAVALALALAFAPAADARRGGSFGSRGYRTYSAPTPGAFGGSTAPIQRSMTPQGPGAPYSPFAQSGYGQSGYGQSGYPRRGGLFGGGLGGGLLGGLLAGGLIGGLMGHGFGYGGGGGGLLPLLIQLAVIFGIGYFALKFFRGRSGMAPASQNTTAAFAGPPGGGFGQGAGAGFGGGLGGGSAGGAGSMGLAPAATPPGPAVSIPLTQGDSESFSRLLIELQDAFSHEDYARLRTITTPEVMSYLAEELSQNAVQGRRNEVVGTRLLQAEVTEAWREGVNEYASAALRFENVDVYRDRNTGQIVQGDPQRPTQASELWTFVRANGGAWLVSAIQET